MAKRPTSTTSSDNILDSLLSPMSTVDPVLPAGVASTDNFREAPNKHALQSSTVSDSVSQVPEGSTGEGILTGDGPSAPPEPTTVFVPITDSYPFAFNVLFAETSHPEADVQYPHFTFGKASVLGIPLAMDYEMDDPLADAFHAAMEVEEPGIKKRKG